jgi:twitching motility protein PilT
MLEFDSWKEEQVYLKKRNAVAVPKYFTLTEQEGVYPFLRLAVNAGASDIHFKNGLEVMMRRQGQLEMFSDATCTPDVLRFFAKQLVEEKRWANYEQVGEIDVSVDLEEGRFRLSVFKEDGVDTIAARLIPSQIPTLEELKLPQVLLKFTEYRTGLVLVTGPTGSGKSTTLASMIDYINEKQDKHIITFEDPIEYLHEHKQSMISQREIGRDTESFSSGLRASLRQDPDIILIGEMRDLETISIALTAAETGHLVFATLHTSSAASTINRIIDVFPADQQMQIRTQLANSLRAVVAQRLVRVKGHDRRSVAAEILVVDAPIANLIRTEKVHQIPTYIQTGKEKGMQTMADELKRLGIE